MSGVLACSSQCRLCKIQVVVRCKSLWNQSAKLCMLAFHMFRRLRVLGVFRIDLFQLHRLGELSSSLLESLVNGARPM